jgi:hypothetical protein
MYICDNWYVLYVLVDQFNSIQARRQSTKGGYTLVTLTRTVTRYRESVNGARDHVTYQKLVTW